MAMKIRKIKKEEYALAKDLVLRVMQDEFSVDSNVYPAQDIDDIETSYGGLGEAFFVGVEDDIVVGTVAVKKEDERVAFLRRIFVDERYRGKKIGSQLMARAIDFCSEVGYQEIVFNTTSRMQAAIALCKTKGFVERAKIDMGETELLKFTFFLRENSPLGA